MDAFRCGHIAIVGRPSVGKSTLVNRLVGHKISITSKKPQTTRHRIMGVLTDAHHQFIFVDTPGFQTKHRGTLNDRLNRTVLASLTDVDVVVLVIDAAKLTPADRDVVARIPASCKVVVAVNKVDSLADKRALLPRLAELATWRDFAALVPVSAEKGTQLDALKAEIARALPEAPALYDADTLTDRDERFLAAEMIREKIFRLLGDEVPYSTTVVIEQFTQEPKLRRIGAVVLCDKAGQRAIIVGEGGATMKKIASEARRDMESLFGGKVFLEVFVRVRKNWAATDASLSKLGFD
ncbi:MAG: GTPase Era [Betaproteobacteria bacterium]